MSTEIWNTNWNERDIEELMEYVRKNSMVPEVLVDDKYGYIYIDSDEEEPVECSKCSKSVSYYMVNKDNVCLNCKDIKLIYLRKGKNKSRKSN